MKSISTIIASILMLLIVLTLAGTAYLYISGTLTGKTSTAFEIMDSYQDTITIRNSGTGPITSFRSVKIDNNDAVYLVAKSDSSLVGYWKMDELNNTGTTDSSGKNNQGTFNGETFNDGTINGATFTSGQYGSALSFDGNDYVTVTSPSNLPTGSAITITAWIKPSSTQADTTYNGIVSYGPRNCCATSMLLSLKSDGRPSMATWGNDFVPISGPTVNWNQWNFVAVVLNGQSVTLYVNDQSISGTLDVLPNIQSDVLNIGSTDNPGRYFNGIIDEVRIYNRALTQAEIQEDMNSTYPIARTVASYSFEEGSGNTVYDTHNRVVGKYGASKAFDGVNDYVQVSPTSTFGNMNFITLSAWIKFTSSPSGTTQEVAQKWRGWTFGYAGSGWWFELYATTLEYIGAYNDAWSPSAGVWYHVISTYDGTTMRTFVDGNSLATHPEALDNRIIWNNPATSFLGIGAAGNEGGISGRYFNGVIDEVKIYNRALSEQEVKASYNIGSQINAGEAATIKIYNTLSKGTHTLKLCTSSMCNVGYLTIT